ncbi:MAG: UTP--glucose-1-phosphate uridylyltransferase GalU [Actinomycetota bacterium]|nr:UTP--glucose-1-phosphate uridylyltransferase GalU [Actinomycetota bacterium]
MKVRKAVIPAAGLGTRFLPATKAQAKEMVPVVDRPAIQYVVEEAVRAGLDDVIIVTSRGKSAMEDHFDRDVELENELENSGKTEELNEVRRVGQLANPHYIRQKEALGFGHAVLQAKAHVGSEPCAVLVGDEIVPEPKDDEPPLLERMIEIHEKYGTSVVAVMDVGRDEISSYGAIEPVETAEEDVIRISGMVEKPSTEEAPSTFGSRGRYLFTPEIFPAIERTAAGVGGEIQLTDAIKTLAAEGKVVAYVHRGPIYDVGKKLDFLEATIELALRHDDVSKVFKEFLLARLKNQG